MSQCLALIALYCMPRVVQIATGIRKDFSRPDWPLGILEILVQA